MISFSFRWTGAAKALRPIMEEEIGQAIENATMKRAAKLGWL